MTRIIKEAIALGAFMAIVAASILFLAGCAATTQLVTVSSNIGPGIKCTLTNDRGTWDLVTPATISIEKSRSDLHVKCGDTQQVLRSQPGRAVYAYPAPVTFPVKP